MSSPGAPPGIGTSKAGGSSPLVKLTVCISSLLIFQEMVSPARTLIFAGKKTLMAAVSLPAPTSAVRVPGGAGTWVGSGVAVTT